MAKHMTQDDRKVLEARYNAGQSVAGIARAMSFNYSTIYKERKAAVQVSGGLPGGVRHGRSV